MPTDKYDVVWDPYYRRYDVRHVNLRTRWELNWADRQSSLFEEMREAGQDAQPCIMTTEDGYAAATAAMSRFPSRGPYA